MDSRLNEQLDKILALADSLHEGEAVVAVRKARQMLNRDGLSFGDLARAAYGRPASGGRDGALSLLSGKNDYLESQIEFLRQHIEDLQAQMQSQDLQLDFWRRRAVELEQLLVHNTVRSK